MAHYPTSAATDAQLFVAVNNLATALNGAINSAVTTVTVVSTTGFPTAGYITIDNEAISYTGTTGTTFTGCTRGADGTSAASHLTGTQVFHDVVAAHHNVLKDEIKAIETSLLSGALVNVKDAGAVGDGTTDDTTAIQAAITACGTSGKGLFFPPGNYKITASLSLPAEISLYGIYNKTTITLSAVSGNCFNLFNSNSSASNNMHVLISGFTLAGGDYGIYAENGGTNVVLRDVIITAGLRCIYVRGFIQQWHVTNVELSGGDYGIYHAETGLLSDHITLGTPYLSDKNDWKAVYIHGQNITGIYFVATTGGVGDCNSFSDLVLVGIKQHGFVLAGGFLNTTITNISTERVGYDVPTRADSTATTTASSATVTVASGTNFVNGQVVTIKGAGTNGVDWYPTISTGGGTTTLVMTTTAPTSVSAAAITNALYSEVRIYNPNSRPRNITFITPELHSVDSRYSVTVEDAQNVVMVTPSLSAPAYDPNVSITALGNCLQSTIRRPNNYKGEVFQTTVFNDLGAPRSVFPSPPGGDLALGLVDSTQNAGGTFGKLTVRIPAVNGSANATEVFSVDSTGAVVAAAGATVGGNIAMASHKLTGLAAGSTNGDSLRYEQLVGAYLLLTGGTLSGNLDLGGSSLLNAKGGVLQVVSQTKTSDDSTTSASFADTTYSVTFSPKLSTSKIILLVCGSGYTNLAGNTASYTIANGSTSLLGTGGLLIQNTTLNTDFLISMFAIDSPGSTSSQTYKVRFKSDGTHVVHFGDVSGNIIAIEVGA